MNESVTPTLDADQALIDTVIIDTGCANLSSVRYAFERLNADVCVTDNPTLIAKANRVVLPGVGSAGAAMASLKAKGLVEVIQGLTQPVLGVCLGMQMLSELSKERGATDSDCQCLGLIPITIEELDSQGQPLPHMGWNKLMPSNHELFAGLDDESYVYFVHSYRAPVSEFSIAECEYGEIFSAAIAKDNFMGVQFHPEKSATVGAKILSNFLKMNSAQTRAQA